MNGKLYLVATPIGNLQDITLRAIETLRTVDVVACEDTRHTQKLLNHLGIRKKLFSFHEHNEEQRCRELIGSMNDGRSVAVVSDAGTPGISDPGFRLVQKAIESGIETVPIPGPSALVAALVASGLPTDSFLFAGFLPYKKGERRARLSKLAGVPATLIFYEAPHRIEASLKDCLEVLGDRRAVLARELTKIHEEFIRELLSDLLEAVAERRPKGEIVLLVDRTRDNKSLNTNELRFADRIAKLESSGLDRKTALKQAAKEFGLKRAEAYRELQNAKKS
jgi:16S rRNA (cytidine1402-2'-O)-methyltransferase